MAEVIQACKQKCSEGCLINIQSTFNKKISVASSLMTSPSSGFCSDSKYQMYFLSYILCLRSNRLGYMQNNHSIIVSFNTPCLSWWYYSTHGPWDPSIFDNNFFPGNLHGTIWHYEYQPIVKELPVLLQPYFSMSCNQNMWHLHQQRPTFLVIQLKEQYPLCWWGFRGLLS